MVEQTPKSPMQREFTLAMVIFVAMAIVGTAFGLWMVSNFAATHPPATASLPQ